MRATSRTPNDSLPYDKAFRLAESSAGLTNALAVMRISMLSRLEPSFQRSSHYRDPQGVRRTFALAKPAFQIPNSELVVWALTWAPWLIDDVEGEDGGVILGGKACQGVDAAQEAPDVQLVQLACVGIRVEVQDVLALCNQCSSSTIMPYTT